MVELVKVEYDCGDKRSYGSVEIEAKTQYGVLKLTGKIAPDSTLEDAQIELNGKDVTEVCDVPDPGLPHYYAPARLRRLVDEKKHATEAVEEWCQAYARTLS